MDENQLLNAIQQMITASQAETSAKLDVLSDKIESLRSEMKEGFQATRTEIVEAIETVGKQVDHLEATISDVEDVTARNAFDVQLLKQKKA